MKCQTISAAVEKLGQQAAIDVPVVKCSALQHPKETCDRIPVPFSHLKLG